MSNEEIVELLNKPFKSENGHFEFNFLFDTKNEGKFSIKYLATGKEDYFPFQLSEKESTRYINIDNILINLGEGDFTSGIHKPLDSALHFLQNETVDISATPDRI